MKTRLEREAKLEAADSFQLPAELPEGFALGRSRRETMRTAYFDTADLRLARYDASLRHREGEGWTLKLPEAAHGQALVRQEHIFDGGGAEIPGEALDLVQAIVRRAALACVAKLETTRRHVPLLDGVGQRLGEIVDDQVAVMHDGRASATFREVEVELAEDAPDDVLDTLVETLIEHGAIAASPQSKVVRALGDRAKEIPAEETKLGRHSSIGDLVRAVLQHSVQSLVRNDPGVRLGEEAEHVHQARVATRRLRSNLRTFEDFLAEQSVSELRSELKWLGAALGAVRDTEVLLDRLVARTEQIAQEDRAAARSLLDRLAAERDQKRAELLIVLRSDRYLDLLEVLSTAAGQPPLTEAAAAASTDVLAGLVRQPWRKLKRSARSLGTTAADADLHALRILAKRTRYAAEAVVPLCGSAAQRFASACQRVQDVLGEHQDCVVAQAWLRRNALTSSSAEGFAAGQLTLLERESAMGARALWPNAWERLDKKELRRWMRT